MIGHGERVSVRGNREGRSCRPDLKLCLRFPKRQRRPLFAFFLDHLSIKLHSKDILPISWPRSNISNLELERKERGPYRGISPDRWHEGSQPRQGLLPQKHPRWWSWRHIHRESAPSWCQRDPCAPQGVQPRQMPSWTSPWAPQNHSQACNASRHSCMWAPRQSGGPVERERDKMKHSVCSVMHHKAASILHRIRGSSIIHLRHCLWLCERSCGM